MSIVVLDIHTVVTRSWGILSETFNRAIFVKNHVQITIISIIIINRECIYIVIY